MADVPCRDRMHSTQQEHGRRSRVAGIAAPGRIDAPLLLLTRVDWYCDRLV